MGKVCLALIVALALTGAVVAEEVVEDPFAIADTRVVPAYPAAALAAGFEGSVAVAAVINTDGSVGAVEVVESSSSKLGFEESAIDAMKQWHFSPARVDGQPVDSVYAFVFYFGNSGRSGSGGGASVYGQLVTTQIGGVGIGVTPPGSGDVAKPGLSRGNFPAIETVHKALQKVKKAPECQGCLYDRRDLIPPKSAGYEGPNRPR